MKTDLYSTKNTAKHFQKSQMTKEAQITNKGVGMSGFYINIPFLKFIGIWKDYIAYFRSLLYSVLIY